MRTCSCDPANSSVFVYPGDEFPHCDFDLNSISSNLQSEADNVGILRGIIVPGSGLFRQIQ